MCTGTSGGIPGRLYRDNSEWFPPVDQEILLDRPSPEKMLRDQIDSMPLRREARRKAKRLSFDCAGRLKRGARDSLHRSAPTALDEVIEMYPLTHEALSAFGRYFAGTGSRQQALQGLKDSFADLNCFRQWYEKHWNELTRTSSWLRTTGTALRDSLTATSAELCQLYAQMLLEGQDPDSIAKGVNKSFRSLVDEMPISAARRLADVLGLRDFPAHVSSSWETMPSRPSLPTWHAEPFYCPGPCGRPT